MCSQNNWQRNLWGRAGRIGALSVAAAATTMSARGQEPSQPATEQSRTPVRHSAQFRGTPGASYLDITIPGSITSTDLAWYTDVLSLDETQKVFLNVFFEEYQQRDADLRSVHEAPLWETSRAIAESGPLLQDPALVRSFEDLMDDRDSTVNRMKDLDDWLFSTLQEVLTETQIAGVPRARARRHRIVYRQMRCEYPGGGIDLSVLLHTLDGEFDLITANPGALNNILAEYERAATDALRAHYEAKLKLVVEMPKFVISLGPTPSLGAGQSTEAATAWSERLLEGLVRLNRRVARAGKRLHALNRRYLASLGALLEPQLEAELIRRFRTTAYPPVYPDPYDADRVLAALEEIELAAGEQRDLLDGISHLYRVERDNVSEQMVRRYISWREEFVKRRSFHPDASEAYKQEMDKLQEARAANATKLVAQIKGVLTPEQLAAIMPELLVFESKANAHEPRQIGIRYRP